MDLNAKSAFLSLRFPRFSRKASPWDSEAPIREELFSVERLESHARSLALPRRSLCGRPRPATRRPTGRQRRGLLAAYRDIVKATDEGRATTPAAEWLIDNYHLVEKQIHQIGMDLPPGYYRQLPNWPRAFRRLSARVRHGLGVCRPHRQ